MKEYGSTFFEKNNVYSKNKHLIIPHNRRLDAENPKDDIFLKLKQ